MGELWRECVADKRPEAVLRLAMEPKDDYPHWDKLRHLKPPEGLSSEE